MSKRVIVKERSCRRGHCDYFPTGCVNAIGMVDSRDREYVVISFHNKGYCSFDKGQFIVMGANPNSNIIIKGKKN